MKSRAAIAIGPKLPLEIAEIDVAGPKAGEVLVEIFASGVCHTDAFTLSGNDATAIFPSILGHEGAGIVRDVGAGVTTLAPGDHVIPLFVPECRVCRACTSHRTNVCTATETTQWIGLMPDGTTRFSDKRGPIHHYIGCSTFTNFTVVPEIALAKVRPDAPLDKICYLGCGVTTGIGAVINTAKVWPGATVVVFGLGGIGLNVVQGARLAGASRIIGVDMNPAKREIAERFGVTDFIIPGQSDRSRTIEEIKDLSKGGVDFAFECIGNVAVMRDAFQCLQPAWGHLVVVGVAPTHSELNLPPFELLMGKRVYGTVFGGARGRTDLPNLVDWYMDGRIVIDELITHTMPIERINNAFDLMHRGESIRSVVTF
jgi:S-(hydroxymethyl)glutathione dehydrogenase/alcohol dehydrogenase